jgi:hypothetical protein
MGTIAVVVVAVVEIIAVVWIWAARDSDRPRAERVPGADESYGAQAPESEEARPRVCEEQSDSNPRLTRTHHNARGSYFIDYPRRWTATAEGSVTTLTSPGKEATFTVGVAPRGKAARAMDRLVDELQEALSALEIERRDSGRGRCATAWVAGRAENSSGVSLRFRGQITRAGSRNYALGSFVARSEAPRFLPTLRSIFSSLRANQA